MFLDLSTPKQTSSSNNHDDDDELPLDIPDLPDVPHFPHIIDNELAKNQDLKNSFECTDFASVNESISQTNHIFYDSATQPQTQSPPVISNSETDNVSDDIDAIDPSLQPDTCPNQQANDVSKMNIKVQNVENSSPQFKSNDNVYRSESPPSLEFSAEGINGDDNQSDSEEFHPMSNTDDVECNFPSLKLDSISDTKSQASDSDETNHLAESEIADVRENFVIANTSDNSNIEVEFDKNIDSQTSNVVCNVTGTNADDSFDDFVEYESNVAEPEKCDFVDYQEAVVSKTQIDEFSQGTELKDENVFAADFSQFEMYSEIANPVPLQKHESDDTAMNQPSINMPSNLSGVDDFNDIENNNDDDDDDEFGEFNDFSDFSQPQTFVSPLTTNVEELTAKIKPLLDSLFPNSDNDSEDGSYDALDLSNDTTKIIKDFENSKALDHQWTSSVGKSTLVTALGIDSRNIVNPWNSLLFVFPIFDQFSFIVIVTVIWRKVEQFNA